MMATRDKLRTEWAKIRKMNGRDRLWYIWEYYKLHILAAAAVIAVIWIVSGMLYRQSFTTRLSIAVLNDQSGGTGSMAPLSEKLRQELNCGKKELIEVNEGIYISRDDASQYSYANMAKISAMVASKALDLMIADRDTIEYYEELSAFADLSQFLPPELYRQLSGQIISAGDENGQELPVALSLEGTDFASVTGISIKEPCIAVIRSSPHKEDTILALRCLFQ